MTSFDAMGDVWERRKWNGTSSRVVSSVYCGMGMSVLLRIRDRTWETSGRVFGWYSDSMGLGFGVSIVKKQEQDGVGASPARQFAGAKSKMYVRDLEVKLEFLVITTV